MYSEECPDCTHYRFLDAGEIGIDFELERPARVRHSLGETLYGTHLCFNEEMLHSPRECRPRHLLVPHCQGFEPKGEKKKKKKKKKAMVEIVEKITRRIILG